MPSVGEEGLEYANLAEQLSPEHTSTVADDLKLHAPKPSLPAVSTKQRIMQVTRTDSDRAASFGIGRPSSIDDSTHVLPSNRSLKKKASTTSQLSLKSDFDDEHGIPEIGQQVPMYKNAGDVQAPSPAPATEGALKAKHHARKGSARGNLPPGSYGLHGHGVVPQDKLEKAYYEKHPELLKKEHTPHHHDRPYDFSMSKADLEKIVRDTANRAATNYDGTPSDQVGWQAMEESTSRVASPRLDAKFHRKSSVAGSESGKEGHDVKVIHVDEPNRRRSVMFSDSETPSNGDDIDRPYTAPILAEDEIAKDPTHLNHQPAVEPPEEIDIPSRPTSRPGSLYKETSFEMRSTPLEDVEEYEPLFEEEKEEKEEKEKPKLLHPEDGSQKNKHKKRFPSADVWEDAPSSVHYTAEVSTPEPAEEQQGAASAIPAPREGETPAQAFARHQEELAEKEAKEHGPEGFVPSRNKQKPASWTEHQSHLVQETLSARPSMAQRFPSRDIWEDAPDSLKLETEVSTPQQAEVDTPTTPVDAKSPVEAKPSVPSAKPFIPTRPKPRQVSGDDGTSSKPAVSDRPKPSIPARPAKIGPTSGGLDSAETAAPPRQKPAVPARPMGSKIAALQAGFMNDLNNRLRLGPQAPPKKEEPEEDEEASPVAAAEEEKKKVPLSDARKSRARGPQRRAPVAKSAPAPAAVKAEEKEAPRFSFSMTVTVFDIDPEEGTVRAGAEEPVKEEDKVETEVVEEPREEEPVEKETEKKEEAVVEKEEAVVEKEEEVKKSDDDEVKEVKEVEKVRSPEEETREEKKDEAEAAVEQGEGETKSLATNMAGETLVEEQIKKEGKGDKVEPVAVEER